MSLDLKEFKQYLLKNKISIKSDIELQFYFRQYTVSKKSLIINLNKDRLEQIKTELEILN